MPCPFADTAADAMPSRDAIRAYLEAHNIEGVLSHAVNASVKNKAADPIQFIISHLASQSEPTNSDVDFAAVRRELLLLMDNPQWDDGSLAPIFIRLAWHSSGTFDKASGTGGSSGAGMRFEYEASDPENAGLATARAFLEPVKRRFPAISYSDLWILASYVAIEHTGGALATHAAPHDAPWPHAHTQL